MDNIVNLLINGLELSPDAIMAARAIALVLVVDVLAALLSAIVPIVRSIR